ncbi:carotenoid biosynthesis protein [Egibacter rhizosphaerae]|uniref:Carotenoid biosynthesis protein n=1 Tax=Egibacter rhizosphaerae TaxID=1670831 RepID=A0A411YLI7_9ACTN|nr:carotenoid biosynthesis protein [Egibacter rhizosphaerae]
MPPRGARAAPIVLGAAVVLLQIAYPLLPAGGARDALTVVTVVVFAAVAVTHAWAWRGGRFAVGLVAIAGGIGLMAELVGVATGFPFGAYEYAGRLGPSVGGVPLVIPLAWTMMAYPAYCVARRLVGQRPTLGVPLAAWALTAWDLYLDPQMVAEGHWRWTGDAPALLGIPLSNYAGWLLVSALITAGLWALGQRGRPRDGAHTDQVLTPADHVLTPADGVPYALYLWVWASSLLAHGVFFGLPGSAMIGGIGMGVVAVPLAVSLTREHRSAAPRSDHGR